MSTGRLLALALLAAALALPGASADHAYSHRYIIYGRVVDAAGNPVPGLTVNVKTQDFAVEGQCTDQPNTATAAFGRTETLPVTNQYGEFMYCYHTHDMSRVSPPSATISVADTNVSEHVTFDAEFREMFVPLQLPDVSPRANTTANEANYTVLGRLWTPGAQLVEGIGVYGNVPLGQGVNVTLRLTDGSALNATTLTNGYGDFAVRIATPHRLDGGVVEVETQGLRFDAPVNATLGATDFRIVLPAPVSHTARNVALGLGAVAVVGVASGYGYRSYRRVAQRRDERRARATSTRKRAQR
jgi:hypothetical protein